MGKSISKPMEGSVTKSAHSVATLMVMSNSGLSWFDYPVNRENRGVVVNLLQDLQLPIIAIWLVSRAIDREINGGFEHWCVKIQAKGCLISIDFLESQGKGAFGLQQRTDVGAELDDFLYYAITNTQTGVKTRHKWEIISSVTPHPLRNSAYLQYLSDHDRFKLEQYMKNAKMAPSDPSKFLKDIKCNKCVSDIADFCELFTADNKGYNPISKNCQQFAAQLFAYLVGDNYADEVQRVFKRYQSPFDKRSSKNDKLFNELSQSKDKDNRQNSKPMSNSRKRRSMQTDDFYNDLSIHALTQQKS